jgi:hypothetical protein
LENTNNSLLNENEKIKFNLQIYNDKNEFLENEIKTIYENKENDLISERSEKENMNKNYKEILKVYKENQKKLMDDNNKMENLLDKKEEENQKMKKDYEDRINHVNILYYILLYKLFDFISFQIIS